MAMWKEASSNISNESVLFKNCLIVTRMKTCKTLKNCNTQQNKAGGNR